MAEQRTTRRNLGLKGEFLLALLPTLTVLAVLGLVEALSQQRLLFASLASSAFLIYLDPLRAGDESNVVLFGLAVGITAALVVLQRVALKILAWRRP